MLRNGNISSNIKHFPLLIELIAELIIKVRPWSVTVLQASRKLSFYFAAAAAADRHVCLCVCGARSPSSRVGMNISHQFFFSIENINWKIK